MGAACAACSNLDKVDAEKYRAASPRIQPGRCTGSPKASPRKGGSPRGSPRNRIEPIITEYNRDHEGQKRATMHVKDGGFRMGDLMSSNPGKIADFYTFEKKVLGEGGFGSVFKAKDKRTGKLLAVKKVKLQRNQEVKLQEEIDIMKLLDHPHIVRLVETFEDKKDVYMCMDLCIGGELFDRLAKEGAFDERTAAIYVRQMLLAVNYLHLNLICHRDLKPENWLLETKDEVGKAPLKLIDFGISKRFELGTPLRTKTGTPAYAAPEVLSGSYTSKVDIWSVGVITYIMLAGALPFGGKNAAEVLQKVREAKLDLVKAPWKGVSAEPKSLLRLLLQKDFSLRPCAKQALEMEWVKAGEGQETQGAAPSLIEVGGLKAFAQMHKVKRAALTVIATQLPGARIGEMKAMFMKMDDNNDGTVSIRELKAALIGHGVAVPEDLESMLKEVDTDGSGVMDYTEFLAATMDKQVYHQEHIVWQAFKKFDMDNNGTIGKDELAKVLGDREVAEAMFLDSGSVAQIFAQVDVNGDGVIDFDEFFAMMRSSDTAQQQVEKRQAKYGRSASIGIASMNL